MNLTMDFGSLFSELDSLNQKEPKEETCCDKKENYIIGEECISCKICHCEITNIIDTPEWRFYGSKDTRSKDPTRCGMPVNLLLPESSLGTSMSNKNRNKTMNRLGMYQRWNSMPYKERSLYKVFVEIDAKCRTKDICPVIRNTAKSLYTILSKTQIKRGNKRKGIIAACVFNACKECGAPRSPNEISSIFEIDPKIMTKGLNDYTEIMRMSKTPISRIQDIRGIKMIDFIHRFCQNLSLTEKDADIITQIAEICEDMNLISDNTPPSMATGCIYLYIRFKHLDITKKDISEECKISEVTINKCFKKIEKHGMIQEFLNLVGNQNSQKLTLDKKI
jgi:transcription initiation factor TFIIB